jgi:hypothetical protein
VPARRQPRFCEPLLDAGRHQRSSGAAMPPGHRPRSGRCLIPMGVWRDPSWTQPSTEETGAILTRSLGNTEGKNWQLTLPKKWVCALDEGPANGCHRNSGLIRIRFLVVVGVIINPWPNNVLFHGWVVVLG